MGILILLVHLNVILKLHACLCNIKGSWGYHVVAKGYMFDIVFQNMVMQCIAAHYIAEQTQSR